MWEAKLLGYTYFFFSHGLTCYPMGLLSLETEVGQTLTLSGCLVPPEMCPALVRSSTKLSYSSLFPGLFLPWQEQVCEVA